jgi:hypothetical protein
VADCEVAEDFDSLITNILAIYDNLRATEYDVFLSGFAHNDLFHPIDMNMYNNLIYNKIDHQ